MFCGRIDHLGTDYPVLRDAFTVRCVLDPDAQQPCYVMANRQDDVNDADQMIFQAASIAFVERMQPDSTIGKLIAQSSSQK